jgi:hypothetical protein
MATATFRGQNWLMKTTVFVSIGFGAAAPNGQWAVGREKSLPFIRSPGHMRR